MAAPSGIVWGDIYGDNRGRIGIYTAVSNTATTTSVNVQVWLWTRYSAYDSTNTLYYDCGIGVTAASTSVGSVSFNHSTNSSWSTNNQTKILDKSYTYTRGKSAATYTIYSRLQGVDWVGAIMHAKASFTVPALASYTVSYNSNGGTGAPSAQTKWHGETLTLSSAKPTRTGYSFTGWVSSAQNQAYAAGAFYGHNESTTMVAQWQANTYPVTYDANGGTGAPAAQNKTYGTDLTLSSTIPTRANYNFLGWATSSSATTAAYSAGGKYTANTAATLYAVWELAYTRPRITNLSVERCEANGTLSDDGTYARVKFDWATDYDCLEIAVTWASSGDNGAQTIAASGRSGSVNAVVGGDISGETAYTVTITVGDSNGNTSVNSTLNGTAFAIDFLSGGKGVAIGKPAEKEAFEVAMTQYDKFGTLVGNGLAAYTGGGDAGIDPDTTLEALCLTSHTNAPKGLGTFFYIHTLFYNTKSATAARTQIAYPYNKDSDIYYRYYASGAWGAWTVVGGGDFAPAGYGLGTTTSKTVTSVAALNDLTTGGWYFFSLSGTTINNVTFNYASVFVCPTNAKTSCYQELRPLATNYVLRRYLQGGTWGEWEIDNPPMAVGKEYRTSERWNGAVVYRKALSYTISSQVGSSSSNSDLTIAHGVSNISHVVRAHASRNRYTTTAAGYLFPSVSASGGVIALQNFNATNITMRFYKDYLGGGTIYIDMAYTKS